MPKGELYINNKDAYTEWGISMASESLSALLTPAPNKEFPSSKSRLANGKVVMVNNPKVDERSVTLILNLTAKNDDDFFVKYLSFCNELETGVLNIKTKYQTEVLYKMIYISCTQFTEKIRGIAKFSLKLSEPNPKDRTL